MNAAATMGSQPALNGFAPRLRAKPPPGFPPVRGEALAPPVRGEALALSMPTPSGCTPPARGGPQQGPTWDALSGPQAPPLSGPDFGPELCGQKSEPQLLGFTLLPAAFGAKFRPPKRVRPQALWGTLLCDPGGAQNGSANGPGFGVALQPRFRGRTRRMRIRMQRILKATWSHNPRNNSDERRKRSVRG